MLAASVVALVLLGPIERAEVALPQPVVPAPLDAVWEPVRGDSLEKVAEEANVSVRTLFSVWLSSPQAEKLGGLPNPEALDSEGVIRP